LIESELSIAPVPRPPQPTIPSRSSRVSSVAARDEWTIVVESVAAVAAVNDRRDMAGVAFEVRVMVCVFLVSIDRD
jgi:hypothetical protein